MDLVWGDDEWPVVAIGLVMRRGIVCVRMAKLTIDHLELSAIHEAAHAVVKWRLVSDFDYHVADGGAGFHHIVIRSEAETASKPYIDAQGTAHHCSGIFEAPSFHTGVGSLRDRDPDFAVDAARRRMRHDVMVTFAGPLAEARVLGCPVESLFEHSKGGSADWQLIEQTVRRMNLPADQHDSLLATLRAKTEAYLDDPQVWQTIIALAKALLARSDGRLTGVDALSMLQAAWRDHKAAQLNEG